MGTLNIEETIAREMADLLAGDPEIAAAAALGIYDRDVKEFPQIVINVDNSNDAGFGQRHGVFSADMQILIRTYRDDDPDGAGLKNLIELVRNFLYRDGADVAGKLNRASSRYTYFAAVIGDSFVEPSVTLRQEVLQIQLKFSPVK